MSPHRRPAKPGRCTKIRKRYKIVRSKIPDVSLLSSALCSLRVSSWCPSKVWRTVSRPRLCRAAGQTIQFVCSRSTQMIILLLLLSSDAPSGDWHALYASTSPDWETGMSCTLYPWQGISTIYLQYRHKLPITHCCCSVSACMMMSVFCLLPASAAVQFVACAHLPITGAEEQILSCLEIITTRLIFTTSGPLLENIQTPPIWRQRTRRRNKEKFSREKLHCN